MDKVRFHLGSARKARDLHRRIEHSRGMYLDLMERSLTGAAHGMEETGERGRNGRVAKLVSEGYKPISQTMLGRKRLRNVRWCTERVLKDGVPGDLIETGVWRGGATIMMRAVLKAYEDRTRQVFVADSFEGLPPPDADRYPADAGDRHHLIDELAVSLEEVRANFERYGLLDDRVRFLKGWFADTLPEAPIDSLSVARLDGDMYGSTWDALVNLYPKLSVGGYLIVDDYGAVKGGRQAVEDYREEHAITEQIETIDWTGVY
ncbi:O-methyltransferase [Rubrobacter radiotolerans DSM 5868]|nr:O-methyltransferase [Rubrobacter radiotolerans DSM 5868]